MQKNVGEFSTFDVVRIIGIDRSRLVHWMNGKFIPAGKDKPWGRGFKTVFSLFDLYSIALFTVCLDVSLSREVARRYWNYVDWERVITNKEWQMVVTRKMDPLQKTKKRVSNITEVKRKSKKSGKLPVGVEAPEDPFLPDIANILKKEKCIFVKDMKSLKKGDINERGDNMFVIDLESIVDAVNSNL